ncbi:unnamed protein product [Darwinula stevensoni]|uniref:Uncharacterized protein n=1 Tax=Darwinula stevensoni TaxID=69355 RepID=A0A7R9ACB8_9CRUS|nr:unnamed protein product [Darwinula stevensoni]CAG0900235.1 unnamed protein product [Darwinula stevensoni]
MSAQLIIWTSKLTIEATLMKIRNVSMSDRNGSDRNGIASSFHISLDATEVEYPIFECQDLQMIVISRSKMSVQNFSSNVPGCVSFVGETVSIAGTEFRPPNGFFGVIATIAVTISRLNKTGSGGILRKREGEDPETLSIQDCDLLYITTDFFTPPWTIKSLSLSDIATLHLDKGTHDLSNTTIAIQNVSFSDRNKSELRVGHHAHIKADRIQIERMDLQNPFHLRLEANEAEIFQLKFSGPATLDGLIVQADRLSVQNFSFGTPAAVTFHGKKVSILDVEFRSVDGYLEVHGDSVTISRLNKSRDSGELIVTANVQATITESRISRPDNLLFTSINRLEFINNTLEFCDSAMAREVSCLENTWAPNCICPENALASINPVPLGMATPPGSRVGNHIRDFRHKGCNAHPPAAFVSFPFGRHGAQAKEKHIRRIKKNN